MYIKSTFSHFQIERWEHTRTVVLLTIFDKELLILIASATFIGAINACCLKLFLQLSNHLGG